MRSLALLACFYGCSASAPRCGAAGSAREALLRQGLVLGLERLWAQLALPAARDISGAGNEANILSVFGGALAEMVRCPEFKTGAPTPL
eukprot:SAG31_NODE_687_length_12813_cov_2.597216_8_plen_89_part_00